MWQTRDRRKYTQNKIIDISVHNLSGGNPLQQKASLLRGAHNMQFGKLRKSSGKYASEVR